MAAVHKLGIPDKTSFWLLLCICCIRSINLPKKYGKYFTIQINRSVGCCFQVMDIVFSSVLLSDDIQICKLFLTACLLLLAEAE